MLVRVDDRPLAYPIVEDIFADILGHSPSAGDIVEESAVISDGCHDADLLIADSPLATASAVAWFPGNPTEVLEGHTLKDSLK